MPTWFQTTQIARPQYYDRNAAGVAAAYEAGIGPHGATNRWTYTCPAGKVAYIESLYAYIVRQTAPGLNVYSEAYCVYLPFGGPGYKFFDLVFNDGTPFNSRFVNQTSFGFMKAGDQLFGTSQNSDTGGAVTIGIAFKGTQCDV